MYLVFDTETTGKPKKYNAPMTDLDNWPRVTQLAWEAYNYEGKPFASYSQLIKPDGWEIPKEKFFIDNGMSTERCEAEGVPIQHAIHGIIEFMDQCKYLIAHNMKFDHPVLGAEMIRYKMRPKNKPVKICTLEAARSNSRGKNNLTDLHARLLGFGFDGAHEAMADVRACSRVFFKMKELNIINLNNFQ